MNTSTPGTVEKLVLPCHNKAHLVNKKLEFPAHSKYQLFLIAKFSQRKLNKKLVLTKHLLVPSEFFHYNNRKNYDKHKIKHV